MTELLKKKQIQVWKWRGERRTAATKYTHKRKERKEKKANKKEWEREKLE